MTKKDNIKQDEKRKIFNDWWDFSLHFYLNWHAKMIAESQIIYEKYYKNTK